MTTTARRSPAPAPRRARWRSTNELVGLALLPFLLVGILTGLLVWLLTTTSLGGVVGLIAVHAYVGLVGAALLLLKVAVGVTAWRRRSGPGGGPRDTPAQHVSTAALLVVVLALYGSGVAMYANVTPGGNGLFKTVHLWSALAGVPVVSLHLWRFLGRARTVVGRTTGSADPAALRLSRQHLLVAGGLALLGWGTVRSGSQVLASTRGNAPNDFPVTLTAGGADQPDPGTWAMRVDGDVGREVTVTLADLRAGDVQRHRYSLDCVLGWSVTRTWGGLPLRQLVHRAAPDGEYISVVVRSTTGYQVALLRDTVEDPRTLVAFEVDGVDLTAEHGFPARVVAPGVIGEYCLKWVQSVTVVRA